MTSFQLRIALRIRSGEIQAPDVTELHRPLRDRLDIRGSPPSWAALIGQLRASFFSSTALAPPPAASPADELPYCLTAWPAVPKSVLSWVKRMYLDGLGNDD